MTSAPKIADLHLHSTASDGRLRPSEIVELAKRKGFSCIALSDHDSIDGIAEAISSGNKHNVEIVPAVELSTKYNGGEVHILGYFIDWESASLRSMLHQLMLFRENRGKTMVEKLQKLGLDISWEEVQEQAGSKNVGRVHIASALLAKGYIADIGGAFTEELIGNDGKAYVEKSEISPVEAITLIKKYLGVSVLAHPGFYKKDAKLNETDVAFFQSQGLQGIEIFHTKHNDEDTAFYQDIAGKYGLKITGGSDCHGGNTGEILMGKVRLPYTYIQEMHALLESNAAL